jgi:hypothetical protein
MIAQRPSSGRRAALWLLIAGGVLLLAGANAHLVYVATSSHPDCVPHTRAGDAATGNQYAAAKSSCTAR